MTDDDRMDALLHEVGGRWRASHPDGATPVLQAPARAPRRWAVLASAAAVAAVIVTGGVVALNDSDGHRADPAASAVVTPQTDPALTGTWSLFGVDPMGGSGNAPFRAITVAFASGAYRIDGLCAGAGGRWTSSGSALTVVPDTARRACGDTGVYAAVISDVLLTPGRMTYDVRGSTLTLERAELTLRFQKR